MSHEQLEFKSPQYKLLNSARIGRKKWKEKCLLTKATLKEVKQNLINARHSRNRWRSEARELRQEITALREQVSDLKGSTSLYNTF